MNSVKGGGGAANLFTTQWSSGSMIIVEIRKSYQNLKFPPNELKGSDKLACIYYLYTC